MKDTARESMRKALLKEPLHELGIDVLSLPDLELKRMYVRLQKTQSSGLNYGLPSELTVEEALETNRLNRVTFRDTYKITSLRRLTLVECLKIERWCVENNKMIDLYKS